MNRFDDLDRLGDAIGNVYADCVDRLMVNIARHFKYLKPGEEPGGAFQYQAKKLAEFGQVNRENTEIIRNMLGDVPQELADGLESAIMDALADVEKPLYDAAVQGMLGGQQAPPAPDPRSMKAFQLYHGQSLDRMNLVNSTMLKSTAEAYRGMVSDLTNRLAVAQQTINAATGQVLSGAESFNSALKIATRRLLDAGLTGFVDGAGRKWAPETYVAMTMRSTYHNVSREAFWERNEEYNNDLYLVSQHPGARPLCYPWQCKVVSRQDQARDVTDGAGNPVHVYAQSETTYGEPAGLFGINCGHHPMLFIPGATKVPELMQNEEENARTYTESQKQRGLEREFRKARLDLDVAKAQDDEEGLAKAREKLKQADERLDRFEKETGRRRRREREYGPVQAPAKPQTSAEKPLTDGGGRGTMEAKEGYFRRRDYKNTGAFAKLKEPCHIDHAKRVMRQMGVLDKNVEYQVDANEEYIDRGLFGHTSSDGKTVTLYPDAFADREQLVKTCGHETVHVGQVRERGSTEDTEELLRRELEARGKEKWYWDEYKKRMKIK